MNSPGLAAAAKRTLSALLKDLPGNGVGCRVARETWHPASGKHWEVTAVRPKKGNSEHLEAYGYLYYKGQRTHEKTKRIASVWKYGWYQQDGSEGTTGTTALVQPQQGQHHQQVQQEQQVAPLPRRRDMPQTKNACIGCGQLGHGPSGCPQRLTHTCRVCKGTGHWEDNCQQRFRSVQTWQTCRTAAPQQLASAAGRP